MSGCDEGWVLGAGGAEGGGCYLALQDSAALSEQIPRLRLLALRPLVEGGHALVVLRVVFEVVLTDEACCCVHDPFGVEDDQMAQRRSVVPEHRVACMVKQREVGILGAAFLEPEPRLLCGI